MRRPVLSAILAAALSLFACSEQPTEAPITIPPAAGGPSLVTSCTAPDIQVQIDALFPPGKLRTAAQSKFSSIPKKVGKTTGTAASDKTLEFIDFLLDTYYAGQLIDGTSPGTFDKVLELIQALYCHAGLTPPDLPSTTAGSDIVVGVVFPNSPTTTLVVPSEHAAVTIPTGAAPSATTIVIQMLPDEPQPLRTSLDQYPFFYHFSGTTATGPVTFNLDVTAGICLKDDIDVADANLRLAHNVGPNFGDVEVLPRPTGAVPGLDCSDLGGEEPTGSIGAWRRGAFAWGEKLFLPAELHAASVILETTGVGGTTRKFSEFGIVDFFSNPGAFDPIGPTSSTETVGSTVTRTVLVTSDNGHPINKAPVTFTTEDGTLVGGSSPQTVLTDEDGNASVSWTLPPEPGTYTLTADVPEEDNDPLETTDPPSGNVASTPDVAFDPTSLTFTATATAGPAATIEVYAGNDQSAPAGGTVPIPPAVVVRDQFGNVVPGFTVTFSVTGGGGSITGATAVTDAGGVAAVGSWTIGLGTNTLAATAAGLSGSPVTFTATGTPEDHLLINFDIAPDESAVASGTVVNTLYASQGVTFQKAGTGLCGPDVYASANQPAGFGSAPNVVSLCAPPIASDISENTFGLIQADFAVGAFGVCIDVAPPSPTGFARLDAFDAGGTLIGSASSAAGVNQTLCFTGTGIRRVRFSGAGTQFARFDNLQVDFVLLLQ